MWICIAIFLIVSLPFLANWLYKVLVLRYTQEYQIKKGAQQKRAYDIVSFGSSYARYGFDFAECGVEGCNFGVMPQFLYYTSKMVLNYVSRCKPGAYIIIVLPDLVFGEPGKGKYGAERYALLLSKEVQGDEYSLYKELFVKRFPLLKPTLSNLKKCIKDIRRIPKENREYNLMHNELSEKLVDKAAQRRCIDWIKEFHLKDTQSDIIPIELEEKMAESRQILTDIIELCLSKGLKPVLVVTPVSGIMNTHLSDAFMKKVLYDNIDMANKQNVPVLDYMRDERFADADYYCNSADLLNKTGRRMFTNIVVKDIIKIYARA